MLDKNKLYKFLHAMVFGPDSLKPPTLIINLDNPIQYGTFRWLVIGGLSEIAGPGVEEHYKQMMVWRLALLRYEEERTKNG